MLEVGLTGGIGSGKTTVAQGLVRRGAVLIDADQVVRDVQAPGSPVLAAMAERFGAQVIADDGSLDRAAVAEIVFADPDELKALNAIVHPAVADEMTRQRQEQADTDNTVILDIPLLIESGYKNLAGIIVVDVPVDLAVARLIEFRGFTEDDARARIANQVSRDERRAAADFLVDNSGDLDALEAEIERCWQWIGTLERPEPGGEVAEIRGRAQAEADETGTEDTADARD